MAMRRHVSAYTFLVLSLAGCTRAEVAPQREGQKQTLVTLSKETTYVTEPVTAEGYVDYAGALNQKYGKDVTPHNNALVLYVQSYSPMVDGQQMSHEFCNLLGIPQLPATGEYFIDLVTYAERQDAQYAAKRPLAVGGGPVNVAGDTTNQIEVVFDMLDRAAAGPWRRDDFPFIADWIEVNKAPLQLVVQGTFAPKFFRPIILEESSDPSEPNGLVSLRIPDVQISRVFARALACRAMWRLGEKRIEESWSDLLACHRLGRQVGQGPLLVDALVALSIDAIAAHGDPIFFYHTHPGSQQAERYLRDLRQLDPLPELAEKINYGERFTYLDCVQGFAQGRPFDGDKSGRLSSLARGFAVRGIDWDEVMRMGNHWYDRLHGAMIERDRRVML